jgi:hypothetical protein
MSEAVKFNPDYDPTGIEGGVDTNTSPWIDVPGMAGARFKALRASAESGMFSIILRLESGADFAPGLCIGGLDLLVLSGCLHFAKDDAVSALRPGTWGYLPANSVVASMRAVEATELLMNFFGAYAGLDAQGQIANLLTSAAIQASAEAAGVYTVPSSLAGCADSKLHLSARADEPLEIAKSNAGQLVTGAHDAVASDIKHRHFVDCSSVPWATVPHLPDVGLKILRVSEETGVISLMVRHNGVAAPHNHIGAGDFLVLQGNIGYRAGPAEGYGPGVWFYEPAGARHDATQRVNEDDLIYTANIYGPVMFDEGRGTSITAVLSWMEYAALAEAIGAKLVPNQ